jgi:hypothetical protein
MLPTLLANFHKDPFSTVLGLVGAAIASAEAQATWSTSTIEHKLALIGLAALSAVWGAVTNNLPATK